MNNTHFVRLPLTLIREKEMQKWETETLVVMMSVNRESAISVKPELLPDL